MTRSELEHPGLPIRISVLAELSGFTRHKLYRDIQRGDLNAFSMRCGKLYYWYVERNEAASYLARMEERGQQQKAS